MESAIHGKRPDIWESMLIGAALGAAAAGMFLFYRVFGSLTERSMTLLLSLMQAELSSFPSVAAAAAVFAVTAAMTVLARHAPKKTADFLCRYRYALGALALILLVALDWNGSSVGCWAEYLPGTEDGGMLLGKSRAIRSDEWAFQTPMALSQCGGQTPFSILGSVFRGTETNLFLVAGQPILTPAILFRPAVWGYFVLGASRGLSFFWYSRLIALLLVAFDFGMLLTKQRRWLSLAFSVLVAFSPFVSWWFAVNGLAEMLVFGMLSVLIVDRATRARSCGRRALLLAALLWTTVGFVLTFYPAWQVPLAYALLGVSIGVIVGNRKAFAFSPKRDVPLLAAFLLLLGGCLLYVYFQSADALSVVQATMYPGSRIGLGGGCAPLLVRAPMQLLLPLTQSGLTANACETAQFFDFFPLGLLLSVRVVFLEKKRDPLLIGMWAALLFLGAYCLLGFPEWLAKVTLMSLSTQRAYMAVGLLNLMLLFRALALCQRRLPSALAVLCAAVFAAGLTLLCRSANPGYVKTWMLPVMAVCLFFGALPVLRRRSRAFALGCIVLAFLSGVLVNPVRRGVDVAVDNAPVHAIAAIAQADPDGVWAVESLPYPYNNLPTLAGARTLNATNVYPNLALWRRLDPNGTYTDVVNRYAHIEIVLTEGETAFTLLGPDAFRAEMGGNELALLGVRYVLSRRDLGTTEWPGVTFTPLGQTDGFYLFSVEPTA